MSELESLKEEYNDILNQLGNPELISDWKKFEEFSRRKKKLEDIIERKEKIAEIEREIKENKDIIISGEEELLSLAENEITLLEEKKEKIERELKEEAEEENSSFLHNSIIVEIRAGTGGDEAALFAGDLFRLYQKYSAKKGWAFKLIDSSTTDSGGVKEITFQIDGEKAYFYMNIEGGVHRVQRIPDTEKSGRIHTSTATIAIIPKIKKETLQIRSDELKIDFYRASGAGGQNVNKRETAVRITHIPTGLIASSQTERNQLQNKENAMSVLMAKISEAKRKDEEDKLSSERREQIGSGMRVEKIKTYNFPQDRLTDHRIKKSWHNLDKIMDGEIDDIINETIENLI